jgi:Secretion system C-terminal sorting domain
MILTSVVSGQDTISYLTSKCLRNELTTPQKSKVQNNYSTETHYEYLGDTLRIYGTVIVSCGATHLATIYRSNDSIVVWTYEKGNLSDCLCPFLFEIMIPNALKDSVLNFRSEVYKLHSPASQVPTIEKVSINFFPNPIENHLRVEFNELSKMNKYQLRLSTISSVVLWTTEITQQSSDIDMSAYPAGVYFIQLFDNENSLVINKKIIKK